MRVRYELYKNQGIYEITSILIVEQVKVLLIKRKI